MTEAQTFLDGRVILHAGDCLAVVKTLPDNSVDSVVTDPPYALVSIVKHFGKTSQADNTQTSDRSRKGADGYARLAKGFMGKDWDNGATAFAIEFWAEILRVLKPGAHVVAFGGTRSYHRLACAIEDAGFEIRDQIGWVYGSGFPKSHSVDKATNKMVEARYGLAKCDCLDGRDGRPIGPDLRRRDRQEVRVQRTSCREAAQATGESVVSVNADDGPDTMRDLRNPNHSETERPPSLKEAFLFKGVREFSPETAGYGVSSLRAGLEEQARTDQSERQDVSDMRNCSDKRDPSRPPFEAVSVRGDEPTAQSGRPLRELPSQNRGDNRTSAVVDSDRREPRRIILDDCSGRNPAVARVCTWCGLPDREWLDSLIPLGSALKPAWEPICLARKPLSEKTVAANVLKWGTGAINVDACRVATEDKIAPRGSMDAATDINAGWARPWMADSAKSEARLNRAIEKAESLGRWPANIVLDGSDEVLALFPESKAAAVGSVVMKASSRDGHGNASAAYGKESRPAGTVNISHGDSGSAARFFYSAKADADDRLGSKHPTVKPVDLMRWLCRLVTPPGGTILDPFSGTGTTGEAAWREGFNAVLIEREAEYCADIARRMALCAAGPATRKHESMKARQGDKPQDCGPLFGGTDHAGGGENLSPHISVRRSKT